jgi:hypothetical protein
VHRDLAALQGMPYTFRNKIRLSDQFRVSSTMPRDMAVVVEQGDDGHVVALFTEGEHTLVIYGENYNSPESAVDAGRIWRGHLMLALARVGFGADFGDGKNAWRPDAFERAAAQGKGVAMRDYRLNVYEEGANIVLIQNRGPTTADSNYNPSPRPRPLDDLVEGPLAELSRSSYVIDERQELSLNLLHLSFFESNPETRNVTLVTAVEALIRQVRRSAEITEQLDVLIRQVKATKLTSSARNVIMNALGNIKNQSISEAGQALVRELLMDDYDGLPPDEFFKRSYSDRCNLVHGSVNRPAAATLEARNPILTSFVMDLLDAAIFR